MKLKKIEDHFQTFKAECNLYGINLSIDADTRTCVLTYEYNRTILTERMTYDKMFHYINGYRDALTSKKIAVEADTWAELIGLIKYHIFENSIGDDFAEDAKKYFKLSKRQRF